MAGDWIKMRGNLWTDPRLDRLCDLTGQVEPMVVGGLFWLWTAADQHSDDGFLRGMSLASLDRKCMVGGLGAALVTVGWITVSDDGVTVTHFDEHNGASAKKRMVTAKRVANHRQSDGAVTPPALPIAHASVTPALAREEKRREEGRSTAIAPSLAAGDQLFATDELLPPQASNKPACPHQDIIALYHELLPQCPEIRDWTTARQSALRARWNEDPERQNLDYWRRLFDYIARHNDFLVGKAGKTPFFAHLEWIVNAKNFTKIRERHYQNRD